MKRGSWFCIILLFCACVMSCSDYKEPAPTPNPQEPTTGTWRVTLFSERGDDETSDFNGYTFTFDSNGTAIATKSGTNTNGTWSVTGGSYGSASHFNLNFGAKTDANKPLGELTDNWKIISMSSTEIKLTDDNAASAEFLTFNQN